jgi:hypothetical protein
MGGRGIVDGYPGVVLTLFMVTELAGMPIVRLSHGTVGHSMRRAASSPTSSAPNDASGLETYRRQVP